MAFLKARYDMKRILMILTVLFFIAPNTKAEVNNDSKILGLTTSQVLIEANSPSEGEITVKRKIIFYIGPWRFGYEYEYDDPKPGTIKPNNSGLNGSIRDNHLVISVDDLFIEAFGNVETIIIPAGTMYPVEGENDSDISSIHVEAGSYEVIGDEVLIPVIIERF